MKKNIVKITVQNEIVSQLQHLLLFTNKIENNLIKECGQSSDCTMIYFKNQLIRFNIISYDICALFQRAELVNHYGLMILYRSLILDIIAIKNLERIVLQPSVCKTDEINKFSRRMLLDYAKNWHDIIAEKVDKKKIKDFFADLGLENEFHFINKNEYVNNQAKDNFKDLKQLYLFLSKFDHFSFYTIQELNEDLRIGPTLEERIIEIHKCIYSGIFSFLSIYCNFVFEKKSNIRMDFLNFFHYYSNSEL